MRLPTSLRHLAGAALALCLLAGAAPGIATAADLWSDVAPSTILQTGERQIVPDRARTVSVDLNALRAQLELAPARESGQSIEIELPMPYGGTQRFAIAESPIMAPELAAKFPELTTYWGRGVDDPAATGRFDLTPTGFHGMVVSPNGSFYIDPWQRDDTAHYQSYYKHDFSSDRSFDCTVERDPELTPDVLGENGQGGDRSGTQLRTYRTVVAATGEYTAYHGGTVAAGMAAIVTAMNRVNEVYEREVSIHMTLVANNDLVVYTNSGTDPYTNNNGSTMLGQNQANLDAVIGTANYDIGHVFSTGGGGIAGLAVICRAGLKARGVTGLPAPIGDPFYIDYVAHEMGHQYAGNHTFNGNAGSCAGGNRNAATAYEPGSGSTIMAYAGICGSQNLQTHSDDYFHWVSIQEIVNYTNFGAGNGCPVTTATGAIEPTVDAGTGGFAIPLSTPFALTATATTTGTAYYCWEEADLGAAGHPNAPSGNAPIFRSFDPVTSPSRTFPKQSDLLNNVHTIGELLPTYTRSLNFRVTVRDVQAGGVGVNYDNLAFTVASSGPFLVTDPNTAVTWSAGALETVTWDVAGTTAAPVSCANVNILLSVDGGVTWPYTLASNTPNDGVEQVNAPAVVTTTARVKVEAADNVFFDISNTNFEIQTSTGVADAPIFGRPQLLGNQPNPFGAQTTLSFVMPRAAQVNLEVFDLAGRRVRTLVSGETGAGDHHVVWDGTDSRGHAMSAGVYLYRFEALGSAQVGRMTLLR